MTLNIDQVGAHETWDDNPYGIKPPKDTYIQLSAVFLGEDHREVDMKVVKELAENIKTTGLQTRIMVEQIPGKGYKVIAGVHRYQALNQLGVVFAPIRVFYDLTDDQREYLMRSENTIRKDLTPEEKNEWKKRLKALELKKKESERSDHAKSAQKSKAKKRKSTTDSNDAVVDTAPLHGWKPEAAKECGWSVATLGRKSKEIHKLAKVTPNKSGKYVADDVASLVGAAVQLHAEQELEKKAAAEKKKSKPKPEPARDIPATPAYQAEKAAALKEKPVKPDNKKQEYLDVAKAAATADEAMMDFLDKLSAQEALYKKAVEYLDERRPGEMIMILCDAHDVAYADVVDALNEDPGKDLGKLLGDGA